MAIADREAAMVALEGQIKTVPNVVTVSRKLRLWSDLSPEEQPAVFITDHTEGSLNTPTGMPDKRTILVRLFIYARVQDEEVGSTILNQLITDVETAIAPDNVIRNANTLGGLVHSCVIQGNILKEPGDLSGQALALISLVIFLP